MEFITQPNIKSSAVMKDQAYIKFYKLWQEKRLTIPEEERQNWIWKWRMEKKPTAVDDVRLGNVVIFLKTNHWGQKLADFNLRMRSFGLPIQARLVETTVDLNVNPYKLSAEDEQNMRIAFRHLALPFIIFIVYTGGLLIPAFIIESLYFHFMKFLLWWRKEHILWLKRHWML